jgi:hypothetical protein
VPQEESHQADESEVAKNRVQRGQNQRHRSVAQEKKQGSIAVAIRRRKKVPKRLSSAIVPVPEMWIISYTWSERKF